MHSVISPHSAPFVLVAICSETSILRYELWLMGRANTKRRWFGVYAPYLATGGKNWPEISKHKWNEIELRSFYHSICLDELIILVWSEVQIGYKMTELWPSQDWPKVAMRPFLDDFWSF